MPEARAMPAAKVALAVAVVLSGAWALSRLPAHGARPSPLEGFIEPDAVPAISLAGGRIVEILAHQGERVVAGQLLLRFEATELDLRLARIRAIRQTVPDHLVDAAASLFERLPPSTLAHLMRSEPELIAAEQEYADALGESERKPSAASRLRLKRATEQRTRANHRNGELRISGLVALRQLEGEGLETMHWLENQRAAFEVRAPAEGVIELLDLSVGNILPPVSPVALIDRSGQFVVRARVPEGQQTDAAPGRRIQVELSTGYREPAVVECLADHELRARVLNPSHPPAPGDKVRVFL